MKNKRSLKDGIAFEMKRMGLSNSLKENSNCFKEVMLNALPYASQIVYQFILNMGFKVEENIIKEQIRDCIMK